MIMDCNANNDETIILMKSCSVVTHLVILIKDDRDDLLHITRISSYREIHNYTC